MVKKFTLIYGIIFVVIGVLGFIPGFVSTPEVAIDGGTGMEHGRLFGLFPVNLWHNLVHLAIGAWGVYAARDFDAAITFCKITAVIYTVLTVFGFFPGTNTLFGLTPLYGHDIWLHALSAAFPAYFGYIEPARSTGGTGGGLRH
jgi:hypothetical protein